MGQQLQILQWIMTIMDHNHYETAQTPSNWDMWVSASNVHGDYAAGQGHSRQMGGDSLRDLSEQHDPPQLARRYTVLPCSLLQYAAHLPGSLPQKLLC